jgi:hypothetical protein
MAYPRPYKENALATDWYTKLVLTVLAACAAVLVAQDLRGAGDGEGGRYTVQLYPMARMMLKTDTETGKTWRASFPDPKVWLPIADEPLETLDDAPPAKPEAADDVEDAPEAPAPGAPATPPAS